LALTFFSQKEKSIFALITDHCYTFDGMGWESLLGGMEINLILE